ncbi:hypothetical protein [uncultured Bilophila sp.]|uniref:hypothetical protein n=1 Tax=uncultured Bilophila sp. TaxID=529385 RepID=UPI0025CD5D54|nr:hypothetical protein [uncultured Bilophila sp.]
MSTESSVPKEELNTPAGQQAPEGQADEKTAATEAVAPSEVCTEEASPAEENVPEAEEEKERPSEPQPAPQTLPPLGRASFAARSFHGLAAIGPLVLILFWAIESLPTLLGKELPALHLLGTALVGGATATTLPSPDLYPVYDWFLSALNAIPGIGALSLGTWLPGIFPAAGLEHLAPYPVDVLPLASALAALFLLLLTWTLARATSNDRRIAFASGLVLLSSLTLMGLPRIAGSDMLFASILTLSGICLYKGWLKTFAPLWLFAGFGLIALSALAGGLPGLALPLLTSFIFLIWRGTFRRAGARDGALAFGLMLVLLLGWGAFTAFQDGGRELLKTLVENEYVGPIVEAWNLQGRDAWISLALLALIWLPWTALLLFLPWGHIGAFFKGIIANRTQRPGQGWIWCSLLVGLAILALLGANMTVLLIPVLPPLAILTAQGLLALSARGSRGFFLLVSVALVLTGLVFAAAHFYPLFFDSVPAWLAALQPAPLPLVATIIQIGGLILIGLILWKGVNRSFAEGSLLLLSFLLLLYAAPLAYYSVIASETMLPASTAGEQAPTEASEQPQATPPLPVPPAEEPSVPPAAAPLPAVPETAAPAASPQDMETPSDKTPTPDKEQVSNQ